MPFLEHLDELRKRLFVVIAVVGLASIAIYFFTDPVYRFLIAPISPLIEGGKPVTLRILDAMTLRFKLALYTGVVVSSPIIIWQTMGFFLPALKPHERRWVVPTFIAIAGLFLAGAAFCYTVILGPSFEWLVEQNGSLFDWVAQGTDLLFAVIYFMLGFGLAFQTPVIVFYLVYFGVVPYKTLRENWRVAWVIIAIVSAMATPDWSPVTMGALAAAMIVLFELSMFLVRALLARKIRAQQAEDAED